MYRNLIDDSTLLADDMETVCECKVLIDVPPIRPSPPITRLEPVLANYAGAQRISAPLNIR